MKVLECAAMSTLDWLTKYEAVAVWLEGIALVAIFIWDRIDANRDHKETVAQLRIAQDQIKLSQNAERAWVMTELGWPQGELQVVTGASRQGDQPQVETTTVSVKLVCRNQGRSPAWVDTVQGYAEIAQTRLKDLPPVVGHQTQHFHPIGPIAPGDEKWRILHLEAPGQLKNNQLLSLFVLIAYRDIFEEQRITTCGYTVSGTHLDRQDQFPDRNQTL
jgi:hypothetical protein